MANCPSGGAAANPDRDRGSVFGIAAMRGRYRIGRTLLSRRPGLPSTGFGRDSLHRKGTARALLAAAGDELFDGHRALFGGLGSYGDRLARGVAFADDDEVGDFFQDGGADLGVDLFGAQVGTDADAGGLDRLKDLGR